VSSWYDDYLDQMDEDAEAEDDLFDWDDGNRDHIGVHGMTPSECQEALLDPRLIRVPAHHDSDEPRWAILGATEDGGVLFVAYTKREHRIRVVTARNATQTERKRYRRR
jgi:uncharacterized protein